MCKISRKVSKLEEISIILRSEQRNSAFSTETLREGSNLAQRVICKGSRLLHIRNKKREHPKSIVRREWECALSDWEDWKERNEIFSYIYGSDIIERDPS